MSTTEQATPRIEILIVNARRRVSEFYEEQQREEQERKRREAEVRRATTIGFFKREAQRALGEELLAILAGEWDVNSVGQALLRFHVNGRAFELFHLESRESGQYWRIETSRESKSVDEQQPHAPPFTDRLLTQIGTLAGVPLE